MKKKFSILALIVFSCLMNASAQVDIKVSIMPPYPSKVTDYASRPQQVLIVVTNTNRGVAQDIQLRGTITGDNGISLRVDPRYRSPGAIHLQPGETKALNGSNISQLFDYNQLIFSGISKDNVIRANGLPEGNYQICIQAFNYANDQPLSAGEPLGCSNIFPITSVEPPVILNPINEQALSSLTTQNFVISWTTPAGAPPSTQYTVSMVEILDGRNPNDAFNSATSPMFFQQVVPATNILLYGPAMPALTVGRHYALAVTAKDPFNSVTFRNNGRSEVISFVYGDTTGIAAPGNTSATGNTNNKYPTSNIKGHLTWYYRRSEQAAPTAKTKYEPSSGWAISPQLNTLASAAMKDISFVAAVKPVKEGLSNPGGPRMMVIPTMAALQSVQPTAPIVQPANKQIGMMSPTATAVVGGGLGALLNSNDASLFNNYGSESHPLAGTIIKLLARDTTAPNAAVQFAGAAVTDDQGNFALTFIPPATFGAGGFVYTLSMQDYNFDMPATSFVIPSGSNSYDLGEVRALANTYRLLPFAVTAADSELVSGIIDVYRPVDFYTTNPSLRTEGNIDLAHRTVETIGGRSYIKVSSLSTGHTGTRLFYSNGNADEYKIKVTAQDYSTYHTSLSVTTATSHPTAPRIIKEVYKLQLGPTTFNGVVSEILGQGGAKRPLPGATVTLYLTEDAYYDATHKKNPIIAAAQVATAGVHVNVPVTTVHNPAGGAPVSRPNTSVSRPNASVSHPNAPNAPGAPAPPPLSNTSMSMSVIRPIDLVSNIVSTLDRDQMTVSTDSMGAFTFSNIPTNVSYMKFVVNVPGSNLSRTDSVLLMVKGTHVTKNVDFTFLSYAVTGRIVDEQKKPIPNALFVWASGGSYGQADANGYFATTNKAGTDTLIVKKVGYQDRRIGITIKGSLTEPEVSSSDNETKPVYVGIKLTTSTTLTNAYVNSIQATPTFKQSQSDGTPISAAKFGFVSMDISNSPIANAGVANWVSSIVQPHDQTTGAVDVGAIVMKRRVGRLFVTVTDGAGKPLNKAAIKIDGTDSTEYTTAAGTRYIQGPGGDLLLTVSGPDGSSFAPRQVALAVNDVDTARITVKLIPGAKISGHVTAGGKAIPDAEVGVLGLDYIRTKTDGNGFYTFIVAKDTSYTMRAARTGYVSATSTKTFTADATLDFTLANAGFNIAKLLGFPVQIDKIEEVSGGHKKLTGSFVEIPGNAVFAVKSGTSIPFANVEVEIKNNLAVPVSGSVSTDLTQLPLKAFNFLPVKLTNNGDPIVISATGSGGDQGEIKGMAMIDYPSFVPAGISNYVEASAKQYIQSGTGSSPQLTTVIDSKGSLSASTFGIGGAASQHFDLYGFSVTLDLAGSKIQNDGLHLKGSISLGSIPLLSNTNLQIKDLWIGTNGYIAGVDVNMDPAPSFSIAGWGATLSGLSFNDNGFTVSGNIKIQIPGSQQSRIDFANLNIAADQLFGGSFTIPDNGIDVFGVVKFLKGPVPLSFGKLGSSNVYYVGGSGTVKFPALFDNMTLKFFQIQTNGQFAATVPANINQSFLGLAKVTITEIGFRTTNGLGVDIQGNFLLTAIPFIKANVGGVHFGTGGSVSVDDIGLGFDLVGIAAVKANIKFVNQPDKKGFEGSGAITIIGLAGVDIGFSYYKVPNGISVAANFKANITIPVGVVSISNPGGGFSLNTGDGSWSVMIRGDASIASLGTAVAITNISVTVSNGPVIKGTAGLSVLTVNVANASLLLDIPKSLFTVEIKSSINLIPKVVAVEGSSIFTLSAKKNDTYFMIGAQFQASLAGIFNSNANITAGWGVNVARHPELAEYTSFIDPVFLDNGVVKGVYLQSISTIHFAFSGDILIASGKIWYDNKGEVKINMGIGSGNYGLTVGANWDCGASLSVVGFGQIGSIDIGTNAELHLQYINGCFGAGGSLAAHLVASIGNCDDDCFTGLCMHHLGPLKIIPEGAKICIHPGLRIGYDCSSGFHMSIDI